jgi:hypothetical protein
LGPNTHLYRCFAIVLDTKVVIEIDVNRGLQRVVLHNLGEIGSNPWGFVVHVTALSAQRSIPVGQALCNCK